MASERQIQRTIARHKAMRDRELSGEDVPGYTYTGSPPTEDKTVPAGRNSTPSRVKTPPPENRPKPEKEQEQAQETRVASFTNHVSPHVAKADNGLHGSLERAAKRRITFKA